MGTRRRVPAFEEEIVVVTSRRPVPQSTRFRQVSAADPATPKPQVCPLSRKSGAASGNGPARAVAAPDRYV